MSTNEHIGEIDGYDYSPPTSGGKYLRLKNKGDSAVFRIVSNPCSFYANIVDGKTGENLRKQRFGWIVAHKEQDAEKKTKITIRGFEAGVGIYLCIKKFAEMEDEYGDPRTYDIKITRTENAGSYYDVVVLPKSIGKPIEGIEKLVEESGLTLKNLFLGGDEPKAADEEEYDVFADE